MDGFARKHELHTARRRELGAVHDVRRRGAHHGKLLPKDPKQKMPGMGNRVLFAVGNAAFFSAAGVFLASTPAFI